MSNTNDKSKCQLSLFDMLKNKSKKSKSPVLLEDGIDQPQLDDDLHSAVAEQVRKINDLYNNI